MTPALERSRVVRAAIAAAALVVALALVACGDSGDSQPAAGSTTPPAATAKFPVTIEHKFGTTEIPAEPKRVVTVGFNEHDFALALGVKPVGVREFIGTYDFKARPWAPDAHTNPDPTLVGAEELNFEQIAALKPDLILGIYSFMADKDYARLSKIAPTIAQTGDGPDGSVPWDEQLLATGKALGREDQAQQMVDDVEAKFAQAREAHPDWEGKTLAVTFVSGTSAPYVLEPTDLRMQFFESLGFEAPEKTGEISKEQLDLIDQDVVLLVQDSDKGLEADPLFQRLDAAKEGRVIKVNWADHFAGALGFNSPLSRPFLLDQTVPLIEAALDGDPATAVPEVD